MDQLRSELEEGAALLASERQRWAVERQADRLQARDEVDAMLAECQRFQEKDDRLQIKEYEDLTGPTITVHAFYVKYLLPIWFDVQSMEWPTGKGPAQRWQYA